MSFIHIGKIKLILILSIPLFILVLTTCLLVQFKKYNFV